ncbi:hypothetical protein F5878DRAFT_658224 [Lentinula raphanica]|uniref:Uncharacterized protein n=1 Tax=Lentinula raphanica TaxID=153919 RepID=A0AA38UKE9_9AGAR|nr:hypothetical protein F5878DRAFT_658224 [Lentinula raphanica]
MSKWTPEETWKLINELKLSNNFKVLYGQETDENSSGDTKHAVHQRIAGVLFESREELESTFKKKVRELKKTGEGVEEYYYIAPSGPDHDTDGRAKTIWDRIKIEFPYFPDLYRVWSTKPNLVPICATTGVGPNGPQFVLIQAVPTSTPSGPSDDPEVPDPKTPTAIPLAPPSPSPSPAVALQSGSKPRSSAFSSLLSVDSSTGVPSKSPTAVSPKKSFEDKMIGIQREMMQNAEKRAEEEHKVKRMRKERKAEDQRLKRRGLWEEARKTLLAEYQSGLITAEQFQQEKQKLEERYGSPRKHRRLSPDWDYNHMDEEFGHQGSSMSGLFGENDN